MKKDDEKHEIDEELLKEMEEEIRKISRFHLFFSYKLHPTLLIHVVLMFLINTLLFGVIQGITNMGVVDNLLAYILSVTLFTMLEIIIKVVSLFMLPKIRFESVGIIDFIIIVPIVYVSFILVKGIMFSSVWRLVGFMILFLTLRFFVMYYIKLYFMNRRRRKL